MPDTGFKYKGLTEKVIGLAMKVHRYFGAGFPESVYKRALMIEFEREGIKFETEKEFPIFYNGIFIRKRRLDLIVEDAVIVELKATTQIDNIDVNQVLNYLRIFEKEVGLLLNFGNKSLFFKRYVNSKGFPGDRVIGISI